MNLEICSITRVKLIAVMSGLQIAWERGYRHVQVRQLDSRYSTSVGRW
ncbi:hypothetical protein LINGRAHAP2_LOCUS3174 [Linum grandiflorum]